MYSINGNGNGTVEVDPATRPYLDCDINDAGHAQCLHQTTGKDFRYNDAFGWLWWNGKYWQRENAKHQVDIAITEMLQLRTIDFMRAGKGDAAKSCVPNSRTVNAVREMFDQLVITPLEDFDANPDTLNCNNGEVNLETGEFRAHDRSMLYTYAMNADYNPDADYRKWHDWLSSAVVGGEETASYLQRAFGYSFTGRTREECFFYMWGAGGSGKGTIAEPILALSGVPFSIETGFDMFLEKRESSSQNFDLAPLRPARLVFASESKDDEWLNAAKLKRLTGGNMITCAFKHKDQFSYWPMYKIWLTSNVPVQTNVEDDAIWSRLRVIEMAQGHRSNDTMDASIKEGFKTDPRQQEAILNWIVSGAMQWYRDGLKTIDLVKQNAQRARNNIDYIQQWLSECTVADPTNEQWVSSSILYQSYTNWCKDNGVQPKHQRKLSNALKGRGYLVGDEHRRNGNRAVVGLSMLTQ